MINRLSKREKILLSVFLLALMAYLFIEIIFLPTLNQYQQTNQEISQINSKIIEANKLDVTRASEEKYLDQAQKDWNQYINSFSTDMQDGLFLVQFSRKLNQEEVWINKFKPGDIEDRQVIFVLPVELEMSGKYPRVVNMLDFLENQANLTEVRHLVLEEEIKENNQATISLSDSGVKAACLLLIYSQPTPQGKLALDDIKNWSFGFGKSNPFESKEVPLPEPPPPVPVVEEEQQ